MIQLYLFPMRSKLHPSFFKQAVLFIGKNRIDYNYRMFFLYRDWRWICVSTTKFIKSVRLKLYWLSRSLTLLQKNFSNKRILLTHCFLPHHNLPTSPVPILRTNLFYIRIWFENEYKAIQNCLNPFHKHLADYSAFLSHGKYI